MNLLLNCLSWLKEKRIEIMVYFFVFIGFVGIPLFCQYLKSLI